MENIEKKYLKLITDDNFKDWKYIKKEYPKVPGNYAVIQDVLDGQVIYLCTFDGVNFYHNKSIIKPYKYYML